MNKNKDIIMISDTDSEYIDKVILILNDNKKRVVSNELLINQAEKIIYEYENKNKKKTTNSALTVLFVVLGCMLISMVTSFLGMRLFY